jgi:hypothetical protein
LLFAAGLTNLEDAQSYSSLKNDKGQLHCPTQVQHVLAQDKKPGFAEKPGCEERTANLLARA